MASRDQMPDLSRLASLYRQAMQHKDVNGAAIAESAALRIATAEGQILEAAILTKFLEKSI